LLVARRLFDGRRHASAALTNLLVNTFWPARPVLMTSDDAS
jgi:hypothetical protein